MGIKQITISALLLAACSSASGPTKDGSRSDGPKTVADSSGSQTGGEGVEDACKTISVTEIDAEEARTLGFAVDEHLALFDRTFLEPFHRGNVDCSALPPSTDGQIEVRASLQGIDLVRREPARAGVEGLCPPVQQMYLKYRAVIELATDDGTLTGSFEGWAGASLPDAPYYAGLVFSGGDEPAAFSGSLGLRVDASRPYVGRLGGNVALGATVWASNFFTMVSYTDGAEPYQDQGDGIFWPADFQDLNAAALCGWLDLPGAQRPLISIDDFNER